MDCASGICLDGVCQLPTCVDGMKNGAEGDVDCGGWSGVADYFDAGGNLSCAILSGGSMTCFGENALGQLGLGDRFSRGGEPNHLGDSARTYPTPTGVTVVAVSAAAAHMCTVLSEGTIQCSGETEAFAPNGVPDEAIGDEPDELGRVGTSFRLEDDAFVGVTVGRGFVCGLTQSGQVRCWGNNEFGQLGQGRNDGTVNFADSRPVDLGVDRSATSLTAGDGFACAILDDATAKCW